MIRLLFSTLRDKRERFGCSKKMWCYHSFFSHSLTSSRDETLDRYANSLPSLYKSHFPSQLTWDGSNSCFRNEYVLKQSPRISLLLRLDTAPERQSGRKAQISNITAAKVIYWTIITAISITQTKKTVADVIRTCLGPKAMLKMILDPMGGIL